MTLQPSRPEQAQPTLVADQNGNGSDWPTELSLDADSEERVRQHWQQVRCYGFQIGTNHLLAPLNVYCELLTQVRIEALPNSPEHFLGLSNVRGNLVPVYQLEPLLGEKPITPKYALVIGNLQQAGALLINAKPKPYDLNSFQQCEQAIAINDLLQNAVVAQYENDNTLWHMINHKQLFQQLANTAGEISLREE